MDNYFQLPNASSLECHIEGYGPTFPILSVKVVGQEIDYIIIFERPMYINAPMYWTGANFSIGGVTERERLAKQIALSPEEVSIYRDEAVLFVAEIDKSSGHTKKVEILALHAKLEEKKK
jgi:hypothetical protein